MTPYYASLNTDIARLSVETVETKPIFSHDCPATVISFSTVNISSGLIRADDAAYIG